MLVKVKLYGSLRRFSQKETPGIWEGDLPAGTRIEQLIAHLGIREAEVAAAAMNGKVCALDQEIQEETPITLVTNVGGG